MAAGAECHARVEDEIQRARIGGRMPGGNDPQALADSQRLELALRERDPVGILETVDRGAGERARAARRERGVDGPRSLDSGIEERAHARTWPPRRLGSRLGEHRRFAGGTGVGVGNLGGNRPRGPERVGEGLGEAAVDHQVDPLPGHVVGQIDFSAAIFSSR
jgi:hypothetical protein